MQDDFGEFLQASPVKPVANLLSVGRTNDTAKPKDLNAKMIESCDLSGFSQKASFKFQQPSRHTGIRPINMHYEQSSSSANWKTLDLKTSEFTTRVKQRSQNLQQSATQVPVAQLTGRHRHPSTTHSQTVYPVRSTFPMQGSANVHSAVPRHPSTTHSQAVYPVRSTFPMQGSANVHSAVPSAFPAPQGMRQSNHNQGQVFPGWQQNSCPQQPFFILPASISNNRAPNSIPQQHYKGQEMDFISRSQTSTHTPSFNFSKPRSQVYSEVQSNDFTLPSWMTRPTEIPPLYKDVLKLCATPSSFADTARLYPIFVSSQLPKDVLGHIWSAANRSTPGQLTFSEVYIALALIALAQRGEMNLSVNYVTKLKTPPVPNLQLPTKPTISSSQPSRAEQPRSVFSFVKPQSQENVVQSPIIAQTSIVATPFQKTSQIDSVQSTAQVGSADQCVVDDFADFQSFPVAPSSIKNDPIYDNALEQSEFEDFQSYVSVSTSSNSLTHSTYPDRNLINSPKAQYIKDTTTEIVIPPKTLLGNIDFSKFKSDSTKSLQSAVKSLKITPNSFSLPTLSPKASNENDDFGEFMMNVAATIPPSNNDFTASMSGFPSSQNKMPIAGSGSILKPDEFAELKAAPFVRPWQNHSLPPFTVESSHQYGGNLLAVNDCIEDKYSVFRDIMPAAPIPKGDVLDSDLEFTDFQSVQPLPQNTGDSADVHCDLFSSEAKVSGSSSTPSFFGKTGVYKDDVQSVSSLELPSLSKTITSLSIGSTSPSGGTGNLYSQEKNDAFGDFTTFSPILTTFPSMPVVLGSASPQTAPKMQDDGLYSLDDPISPLSSRKFSSNISSEDEPSSPPKVKRFTVPRRISEADSDFGDFSSGPPPIDDVDGHHHNDFDGNQGGTSSLVDFDAFGHFEEAKEESRMKKIAIFNQKRGKEDATAFSEFVKSSIKDLKPASELNDTSHSNSLELDTVEEAWSAFSGEGTNPDVLFSAESEVFETTVTSDEQLTVELHVNDQDGDGISTTWRLDSTISEPDIGSIESVEKSKWDEEGEELKARIEGTTTHSPMDLYAEHWGRCLATCKDIIESTGEIFGALNSPTVCHEIVNSTRGKEFISCTSEVYGVARRIRKGMESVGLFDDGLEAMLKDIEIAWQNLLGFCPYTPSVHKTPEHCCSAPKDLDGMTENPSDSSACSLCLLTTNGSVPIGLEYGGKSYHAPCANLWLNQIAPILPRLQLPAGF